MIARSHTALTVGLALATAPAMASTPVSPGEQHEFAAANGCPTFSWTPTAEDAGYELVVYAADAEGREPALEARLPAGATSWTPAADRCLAAGRRYGWSVRPRTDRVGGEWSQALLFEVAEPSGDLAAALEILGRYLGTEVLAAALARGASVAKGSAATAGSGVSSLPEAEEELPLTQKDGVASQQGAGGPLVAVRGEVPDATGETYGVRGVSHSPDGAGVRAENNDAAGADLLLGGTPATGINESSLSRASTSNLAFDFVNPGAGTMTLTVDGAAVVTTANDQDTLGGLSCADGQVAKFLSGLWTCAADAGGTEYFAGNQLELVGTTFDVLEGSGSGLDADRLDGLDSTAFLTAGTDDWVNEGGDGMSGTLSIDVPSGFALQTGAGDSMALGGNLFKNGQLLLHDSGTQNVGLGNRALGAVTTGSNNAAVGHQALFSNTTGLQNTAVGSLALWSNGVGTRNTAVGHAALQSSSTGADNTAVGNAALFFNNARENTAVGASALHDNTSGTYNTALGSLALSANTTGGANTAGGYLALRQNTIGFNNSAWGTQALQNNSSGSRNSAVGSVALFGNTSGVDNTALGAAALQGSSTGSFNTAVGTEALVGNSIGDSNTAIGARALSALTSQSSNTAVGTDALAANLAEGNTAVGRDALRMNETGDLNVAVGRGALASNVIGSSSTAIGASSLRDALGSFNTAVGAQTLEVNTNGQFSVAVGAQALRANTDGGSNTAVGAFALFGNTTGSGNTALGADALGGNTTGMHNVGLGLTALQQNTVGSANTASGSYALRFNEGGVNNTAHGFRALQANTAGAANTATGAEAMLASTSGNENAAVGAGALRANTSGSRNAALGVNSLFNNATGSANTAVGERALFGNTTGQRNVALGSFAGSNAGAGNDSVFVAHQGVAGDSAVIRIGAPGTQTRAFLAGVRGVTTGLANAVPVLVDSNGQLGTVSSSIRFKEDVHDLELGRRLLDLRPVSFRYREPFADGERPLQVGLIAEEVARVLPELVVFDPDGRPDTVRYHWLAVLLLDELQRLEARIERLGGSASRASSSQECR